MDKHEKDIKSFGMLQDYNDSEEFLSKHPDLTCDATAGYLALWCINLEVQEVTSLCYTWAPGTCNIEQAAP